MQLGLLEGYVIIEYSERGEITIATTHVDTIASVFESHKEASDYYSRMNFEDRGKYKIRKVKLIVL